MKITYIDVQSLHSSVDPILHGHKTVKPAYIMHLSCSYDNSTNLCQPIFKLNKEYSCLTRLISTTSRSVKYCFASYVQFLSLLSSNSPTLYCIDSECFINSQHATIKTTKTTTTTTTTTKTDSIIPYHQCTQHMTVAVRECRHYKLQYHWDSPLQWY